MAITVTSATWSSSTPYASRHILVEVPLPVLEALTIRDLQTANALFGKAYKVPPLPEGAFKKGPDGKSSWDRRIEHLRANEGDIVWLARPLVDEETNKFIGRAGFNKAPDANGMAEISYMIDPPEQRKGHGKAALRIIIEVAQDDERIKVLRANIRADNEASWRLAESQGFVKVDQGWSERNGDYFVYKLEVE